MGATHKVVGVVDNAYSKNKTTKNGKNVTINYIDVDGKTVSTGFQKTFETGELVRIGVENKFNEWQHDPKFGGDVDSLPDMGSAPAKPAGNSGGGGWKGGPAKTFPVDPKHGDMSIIRQNSMARAIDLVDSLTKRGLFEPANEEEYLAKVWELAAECADFSSGQDIIKLQAARAANQMVNQ